MGFQLPHTGSWGTPDFGVTEWAAGLVGRPSNNLVPDPVQRTVGSAILPGGKYNPISNPQPTSYWPQSGLGGGNVTSGSGAPKSTDEALKAGVDVNTLNLPQPQQSGGNISEGDAIARGWDVNNLPGGYSLYRPGPSAEQQAVTARENQARSDIEGGYNQYFSQLDQMLGGIPGQRTGQEQIVGNNYNQGISDINAQRTSSLGDLATSERKNQEQQVKSLTDIADNIRNLFKTGNVMLGTRGAGDSSAADQYSYAVTQLGSKQRGDVLSQTRSIQNDIADREAKLNNIVTQETGKLKTDRDNQIIQIAQYFQDAQNQILQAKAQGQLQKGQSLAQLSTQLLQQAQNQLMQADANYKNQQNALMKWAADNATNINQLKTNLAAVGQYNVPGIQTSSINGSPQFDAQGNMTTPLWSSNNTKDKQLTNIGSSLYNQGS